jgi:TRAP-type C4-dicarboxylate transport system permease small subunit
VPSGLLVYIFFTTLFLGWGAFEYFARDRVNEFIIISGLGFGIMGIILYRRIKKANLNC